MQSEDRTASGTLAALKGALSKKRGRRGVGFLAFVLLACTGLGAVAIASADAETYVTSNCHNADLEPLEIILSCGDGGLSFHTSSWTNYFEDTASADGTLDARDCGPDVAQADCETIVSSPATIILGNVQFCVQDYSDHFTAAHLLSPDNPNPYFRDFTVSLPCNLLNKPKKTVLLGNRGARHYMKVALHRRFKGAWDHHSFGFGVRCKGGVARVHRCKMQFGLGDISFFGKGRIWTKKDVWFYSYRIKMLDEYCLAVEHKSVSACTKHYVVH